MASRVIRALLIVAIFYLGSCQPQIDPDIEVTPIIPEVDKERIKEEFSDIEYESAEEIKVALLLPLSGRYKKLGKSLLEAAQLAIFDHHDPRIVLFPYDTKASEFEAINLMQKLVENNIKIIVGPLFGKVSNAIAPIAAEHNIRIISFSNDIKVAENDVFILGLDARQQAKRITEYALSRDIHHFATILPGNSFGSKIVKELRHSVDQYGGIVLKTEFYMQQSKVSTHVRRVVQALTEIPVDEEGNPLFREIAEGEVIPTDDQGNPLYYDIKDYKTALLIADGGQRLSEIMHYLEKYDFPFDKVQILGAARWDEDDIMRYEKLNGAWFVDIPQGNHKLFTEHFENVYDYTPPKIASLAYDAISIITTLAIFAPDLPAEQLFVKENFTKKMGFLGTNGIFRFNDENISERLFDILHINEGMIEILDPAPPQFVFEPAIIE